MSYDLISKTTPKARKEHHCIWCCERIVAGEQYVHEISKYEGYLQNHKWHNECREASKEYFADCEEFEPHAFKRGSTDER